MDVKLNKRNILILKTAMLLIEQAEAMPHPEGYNREALLDDLVEIARRTGLFYPNGLKRAEASYFLSRSFLQDLGIPQ